MEAKLTRALVISFGDTVISLNSTLFHMCIRLRSCTKSCLSVLEKSLLLQAAP